MEIIYSFDHYTESWIEVSSQPSTSSPSSVTTDNIITTGLRVQHDSNSNRRRRLNRNVFRLRGETTRAAGSSQEEYEESENESDHLMSSSNERIASHFSQYCPAAPTSSTSEEMSSDGDDDENSTALGITSHGPNFTPQPNAFSHPPHSNSMRYLSPSETVISNTSILGATQPRPTTRPNPSQRLRSHTPYNMISPTHQVDHDAALRASLSTLLSCAAAARGLSKRDQPSQNAFRQINGADPVTLRMVPESVIMGEEGSGRGAIRRRNSTTSSSAQSFSDKSKRKASPSKDRREPRKKRRGGGQETTVAPTLMTWVVSAGVVVLFSVIGFSAGYAIGREVGRMEAGVHSGDGGVMAGKEVGRELRKMRWGSTSTLVRV